MKEFKFKHIYTLAALIDESVFYGEGFWNYDEDYFRDASLAFSKKTLLHLYISTRALNYHRRDFKKNGCSIEEEEIERWMFLFESYGVSSVNTLDFENEEEPISWMEKHENQFIELFEKMGDEAFHILFFNRNFLIKFNELVSETIEDTQYPADKLTQKGTIKRKNIPQWVRNATYHRDKGRCVYCNTDLTGIVNTLTAKNFDHMVPLDRGGANDPCNIQLTCESCNKSKSNKASSTSFRYQPWW